MEGVGVLGLELTYFGAPGVQTAEPVPSSTNRSAAALGWFSRNPEFVLNASSSTECRAEQVEEVVCVSPLCHSTETQPQTPKPAGTSPPAHPETQCRHICGRLRDPRASLPSLTQPAVVSSSWSRGAKPL